VRFSILCASTALAASLLLSACSGGSGSLPTGGSQTASSMGHQGNLRIISATPVQQSCNYSAYYECITVSKATPFTQEWCISTTGTCGSVFPGTWTWSSTITTVKGKKFKKMTASYSPNPGNPSTLTISEKKKVKSTKGKIKYESSLQACSSTYGCVYLPLPIGIAAQ